MVASDRLFAESVQKSQGRKLGKRAGVPSMTDDQARDGNQEDELPFDEELPFELSLDAWRGLTMGLDGSGRDVPLPLPDEPAPGVSNVESHGFSHSPDIFEGCSGASPDRVDRSSKAGLSSDVMGTSNASNDLEYELASLEEEVGQLSVSLENPPVDGTGQHDVCREDDPLDLDVSLHSINSLYGREKKNEEEYEHGNGEAVHADHQDPLGDIILNTDIRPLADSATLVCFVHCLDSTSNTDMS